MKHVTSSRMVSAKSFLPPSLTRAGLDSGSRVGSGSPCPRGGREASRRDPGTAQDIASLGVSSAKSLSRWAHPWALLPLLLSRPQSSLEQLIWRSPSKRSKFRCRSLSFPVPHHSTVDTRDQRPTWRLLDRPSFLDRPQPREEDLRYEEAACPPLLTHPQISTN